ncbi:MAG: hypothetical protein ACJ8FY_21635 [Gemmataceae bacterium]
MKSQMLLVIAAVIALIFGVTFASQFLGKKASKTKSPDIIGSKILYFPITSSRQWLHPQASGQGSEEPSIVGTEIEVGEPGAYDFWFQNTNDVPIEVSLKSKTCKCTEVDICLAGKGDEEWNDKATKAVLASCVPTGAMISVGSALFTSEGLDRLMDSRPPRQWKKLGGGEADSYTVPPQSVGMVRMQWHQKQAATQMLKAEIYMKPQNGAGSSLDLSVPAIFVDPVHIFPTDIPLGTISVGSAVSEGTLICWSSTRTQFTIRPAANDDPFFVCGEPTAMSDRDRCLLEQEKKTRIASAYRIPLSVREQAEVEETINGKRQKSIVQMDLGPFKRAVGLVADIQATPIYFSVQGDVKDPDITVDQNSQDRIHDRVTFGSFPAADGARTSATIGAPARYQLAIDKLPSFLKADIALDEQESSQARKSWKLRLEVLPGTVSGIFPDPNSAELRDTAIYLKMQGSTSRGIRIPVHGNATFR